VKVSTKITNRSNQVTQKSALRRTLDPLLPALLVIGAAAGLMARPASAIELGQLQIDSSLGQPLSASIPFALNPHEELYSYCIALTRTADTAVQSLTRAKITLVGNRIVLTGSKPINEPMLGMRVTVNCPYTVKLAREYTVMINPAGAAVAQAPGQLSVPAASAPVRQSTPPLAGKPAPVIATRPEQPVSTVDASPIYVGDEYRVKTGDTLSKIANRIDGRTVGLWPAIEAIYQANPEAFVNSDKNQLMAGSLLMITTTQDDYFAADPVDTTETAAPYETDSTSNFDADDSYAEYEADTSYASEATSTYEAYDSNSEQWAEEDDGYVEDDAYWNEPEPALADDTANLTSAIDAPSESFEPVVDAAPAENTSTVASVDAVQEAADTPDAGEFSGAQPGDVFAGTDSAAEESVETVVAEPVVAAETPVVETTPAETTPVAGPAETAGAAYPSWLVWAGGGAIVAILGLLAMGLRRKVPGLFGGDSAEREDPTFESDDEITQKSVVLSDVDFQLDDLTPDDHAMELDADLGAGLGFEAKPEQNAEPEIAFAETTELDLDAAVAASAGMELDADLGVGTGLQGGTDLDVAQDFGFSPTGENATPMDLELPVEVEVEDEQLPTDIIPPHLAEEKSILDSEVPPVDDDDDSQYDLSVIVDATKQPLGEPDLTAKDLMAVQLNADQQNSEDPAFTLSKEVDFEILEKDYEEELTQTQAVNEEIARAAMELAERMETEDEVLDVTVEMPAKDNGPAKNDAVIDDADATALTQELTLDDEVTVRLDMDDDDTVDTKNLAS